MKLSNRHSLTYDTSEIAILSFQRDPRIFKENKESFFCIQTTAINGFIVADPEQLGSQKRHLSEAIAEGTIYSQSPAVYAFYCNREACYNKTQSCTLFNFSVRGAPPVRVFFILLALDWDVKQKDFSAHCFS